MFSPTAMPIRSCIRPIDELLSNCGPPHKKNVHFADSTTNQTSPTHPRAWRIKRSKPIPETTPTTSLTLISSLRSEKTKRNKKSSNSQVLVHRKSFTTKWTSIGVRDLFQWIEWILETWGSGRRAVLYIEMPNNKIEFHVTIYPFLFTFFKINWPFSSDSPFLILKAS